MYHWLALLIMGWFGTVWWPGIEVDAPPPGGGDWWWRGIAIGLIGGAAAIGVGQVLVRLDDLAIAVVALATGRVAASIVAPVLRMSRR
jgi:hypothetical protein